MATALNFPSSLTLSYHKLFLRFRHEHHPKILFTTERFAVCAAASRKPRSGRKAMSNVELLDEIKQFLYSVGLPEDHVPSTKELSLHGRIDLANIVRRRGYKLIGELLAESKGLQADGWNGTKIQMETQLAASDSKEALEGQDEKLDNLSELLGLVDNSGSSSTDMPSNDDTSFGENYSSNGNLVVEVEEASSLDVVDNLSSSSIDMPSSADSSLEDNYSSNPSSNSIVNADDSDTSFKYYSSSSLEETVAKFMENDYLEPVEGTINYNTDEEQRLISAEFTENENKIDIMLDTDAEMQLENLDGSESSSSILNQITATKLESTIGNSRANNTRDGQLVDADLDKALDAKLNEQESLNEISHLKQTLQQKEWELSQLKEMIEQERLALSSLQDKVESEISKAQKLILEKDAELQAAEESLSGLVEVEIQYSGEGEIVEVTGSFNGWEHRIKMKPEELPNSTDICKSKQHWSTTLWLYPGMYEIKFVIDGQWKIDAQKETVNKGAITNNILRVHQQ